MSQACTDMQHALPKVILVPDAAGGGQGGHPAEAEG